MNQGLREGDRLMATPAVDLSEVMFKLTELLEWISEDGTPSEIELTRQILADIERLSKAPDAYPPIPDRKTKVDRRARPTRVGETWYPSIVAASRATGIPISEISRA